jgi:hypothetical protein
MRIVFDLAMVNNSTPPANGPVVSLRPS